MTPSLEDFVAVIGKRESSDDVRELFKNIHAHPLVSSTSDEYNDPVGATKYYQFIDAGVECGFRGGLFNHVHFYVQEHEGYRPYKGKIAGADASSLDIRSITTLWGNPATSGGGKMDLLIGYIHPWILYEMSDHVIRIEFSQDTSVYKLTLRSK
ncbi:hypothetical protein [Herbaspirillum seropedicae]|uniref:hypothetical protein n=1 Tax=Herbaspirillum seropedicae TaxID=964 RepID=UPI003D99B399